MNSVSLAGAAFLGIPAIALAWALLWRSSRAVFWFAAALILVGLGYLVTTGATGDMARALLPDRALQVLEAR